MDADDAGGAWGDKPLNGFRGDVMSFRMHVRKYGGDFLPLQRVRRGDEGVGRHNHFATQFEGADGDLQGNRGVAHGDAMFHAHKLLDAGFEFFDQRAVIGEPAPVKNFVDPPQHYLAVAKVWAANVERFAESRLAPPKTA